MSPDTIIQSAYDKGEGEATRPSSLKDPEALPVDGRKYPGRGTLEDPFVVDWDLGDPENPFNWSRLRKWIITLQLAVGTWTVSFCSSSYSGGLGPMSAELHISREVAILGVSLYVLGFGLGPLLFAPMSEVRTDRPVFLITYSIYALFHLGGALGHNAATILSTRLLAGTFGSSPLTNASGVIADMWVARDRGVVSAIYATAPFMGPVIGPIVGGWIVETRLGWRFNFWLMFIFSILALLFGFIAMTETYAPALLRKRATKLRRESGGQYHFISIHDIGRHKSITQTLKLNLRRPFLFLATEPIVLFFALYISIVYATLYAFFAAFPIVFQQIRHFSPGEGGLAFLGVGAGVVLGTSLAPYGNKLYWRAMERSETGIAPPEARLYMPMMGAILCPVGLFWFAWTSTPPIHWIVPILGGFPFGTGIAQIMQGLLQYLMDTYTIYCASAVASTVVLRCTLAAVFPLISPTMYAHLGPQWAASVFAFLSLACTPMPFLFFKYGPLIRSKSKFASSQMAGATLIPSPLETVQEKGGPHAQPLKI
ncbi:hypothetical protein PHLGIDRAFT_107513 [Phlebiopsis gigantea 11061_1 CR5-6]|uniref:Major facilitator superfamily (MFS) profile domain-containing protein n=1 Tax=Phlebiopsis gigantea (strain 11061_1 CR5-6) TaxID=745531 RepID=A0A0C3RWM0_PHLG1|nr:hypothetical protein PHLGIDRAFT_107513 [Phlebiopsis gigantea 11061_1 CR5-6]